jgi:hypothetical protein
MLKLVDLNDKYNNSLEEKIISNQIEQTNTVQMNQPMICKEKKINKNKKKNVIMMTSDFYWRIN